MPSPKALCSASSLPPTVGSFQDPFGVTLSRGFIALDLSETALITGGGELSTQRVVINLDVNGKVAAGQLLYGNDQLTPSTTTYRMTVYYSNGNFAANWGRQRITGSAPMDLALLVPSSDVGGIVTTPITFVQSKSSTNVSSLAFNSNNSEGNLIIVALSNLNQTPVIVTDSKLNTYTQLTALLPSTAQTQIAYASAINSGANTVNLSAACTVAIHEFSGFLDTLDLNKSATGSGNAQSSGSGTSVVANELLFGFTAGIASSVSTIAGGAGFTTAESGAGLVVNPAFLTQYQIVSSISSYTASSTTTTGKGGLYSWGCQLISFYR